MGRLEEEAVAAAMMAREEAVAEEEACMEATVEEAGSEARPSILSSHHKYLHA